MSDEKSLETSDKPPFRGEYVHSRALDMNAELNEPELLIQELKKVAESHGDDKRWTVVSRMCQRATEAFEILHKSPETPIAKE